MNQSATAPRAIPPANRDHVHREPLLANIGGFVDLFVWLLVLKGYFLPLFVIPTGSMAETLAGAHAVYVCPNCGKEYMVGFHEPRGPRDTMCPNCRFVTPTQRVQPNGVALRPKVGDRIMVHGWNYDFGGALGPQRWDVVVFRNPNNPNENFIKRLIGLPNETLEIIDGDVYVTDAAGFRIARKTPHAQESLWFPVFDNDHLPAEVSRYLDDGVVREFLPRWEKVDEAPGWHALRSRVLRFDGLETTGEIRFATDPANPGAPGLVTDFYGYNSRPTGTIVTDVRLGADVTFEGGGGFVELSLNKMEARFFARLHADGKATLEIQRGEAAPRETLATATVRVGRAPIRMALGHADYQAVLELDGRRVLATTQAQYDVDLANPPRGRRGVGPPSIRIAASRIKARLEHVRIDRDIYYTSVPPSPDAGSNGIEGHPIRLGPEDYFVLGDNSPASNDARWWSARTVGPHLRSDLEAGRYQVGTVPADQLIGRAFFVYWPGFYPLGNGPSVLPDTGRLRWIH